MKRSSNQFFVEALDDGTTLHGQLLSTLPLSQAWSGIAAVPDWTQSANQPRIYVDLLSGNTKVTPDEGGTWYYNGTAITWADSTATAVSSDGRFQKVANYPSSSAPTAAIKIIANLAQSNNVDTDSITYKGSYTIGGSPLVFSVSTIIRISTITSSGIFGQIVFLTSNIVREKNQNVIMYGRLFSADGNEITATASGTPFSTLWKKDGTAISPSSGAGQDVTYNGTTYHNGKTINEANIIDNSVVECTFTYVTTIDGVSTTLTYTAYENIDDQTDYEFMYIQYNGGNDRSASLKRGGSVTFKMWMGTTTDPTVDNSWDDWYVKLLDSDGNVVLSDLTAQGIANVESSDPSSAYYGFRQLTLDNESKAEFTATYELVSGSIFKRYLTGLVLTEKS